MDICYETLGLFLKNGIKLQTLLAELLVVRTNKTKTNKLRGKKKGHKASKITTLYETIHLSLLVGEPSWIIKHCTTVNSAIYNYINDHT